MGLVAPQHVGSSRSRARTHVPCIGRQILNHCATREALHYCLWTVFPLFLHSLSPLIINCFNLPFGTQRRSRTVVPKLFGTRDQFRRRLQWTEVGRDGFRMIQVHYIYYALYFYYYYIVIYNEIII